MELETHRPRGRGRQVSFSPSGRAGGWRVTQRLASLIAALFAAATLTATAAPAAMADEYCASGNVCVWNGANYQNAKNQFTAADAARGWIQFDKIKFSIKNHLTNRPVYTLKYYAGVYYGWDCQNPGDVKRGDGWFWASHLAIGEAGTRCQRG